MLHAAWALDPHKSLTQYSRRVWTQQDGLPQDTIRTVAQTSDGYLWIGTDEGLARFDGYEFTSFDKAHGELPSNSITALAPTADGSLWIGTPNGLTLYRDRRFRTYTTRDGLPDNSITNLSTDHAGAVWAVAGISLSRFQAGKFTNFAPGPGFPVTSARTVFEDRHHDLWVAGFSAVGRFAGGVFTEVLGEAQMGGHFITAMAEDQQDNLWLGGNYGIIVISRDGRVQRRFDSADGMPNPYVRALWCDRNGTIWVGTNEGLARFDGNRFERLPQDTPAQVRCLFEDREGDLWVGASTGLARFRDDLFTAYGRSEGLPSDDPNTVFQDSHGRLWVGFHDSGLMLLEGGPRHVYTTRDGLPNNEIFSIRETGNGDLLIGAREGMARMHDGKFTRFKPSDPLARFSVFDVLEDSAGRTWLATGGGLGELVGNRYQVVIPGEPMLIAAVVTLSEDGSGGLWAGTYGKGLWHIGGGERHLYTTAEGLPSDAIRSLERDPDGTLWIGTFGGGLAAFRGGKFHSFTQKDGLLSDNVAHVVNDGKSLWLSTTRGICRVWKQQLREFSEGKRRNIDAENFGVEDGLRSAQAAAGYPVGAGACRTSDGRLWFSTSRGLAIYDPRSPRHTQMAPSVQIVDVTAEGHALNLGQPVLSPDSDRLQFRYTGIHLSAPERIQYSYMLEGLDKQWVNAGTRRLINYNSLPHGHYRFLVRAAIPGGPVGEGAWSFTLQPHYYETAWFRAMAGAALLGLCWLIYQARLRQIRKRFALVLEERARLAREIHDTLAQGFVGISSQLDAVALSMPAEESPARKYLDMARKMARHSLTEARRSVMDLRSSVLENQDLAAALEAGTRLWTAGAPVDVTVDVTGAPVKLKEDVEQHLLRIAQEAVTNVVKHARATKIAIKLHRDTRKLRLRIVDNGRGFEHGDAFSSRDGHFGLIGMRERAERMGGELRLDSHPGEGTQVEVMVPLP